MARDQLIQLQPPVAVKAHEIGDIHADARRAHFRAENFLAIGRDVARIELGHHTRWRHPDNHHRPQRREYIGRAFNRPFQADGDEDVIRPASLRDGLDLRGGIACGGIDGMGRAELFGEQHFIRCDIQPDDRARARHRRALNTVHADAAKTDHRHRRADRNRRRVHHRTKSGDDAASEQRGHIEPDIIVDLRDLRLMHHRLLGKGSGAKAMLNRLTADAER